MKIVEGAREVFDTVIDGALSFVGLPMRVYWNWKDRDRKRD